MIIKSETKTRLDKLAEATRRSKSFHIGHALESFLDANEWQIAEIKRGLEKIRDGKITPHADSKSSLGGKVTYPALFTRTKMGQQLHQLNNRSERLGLRPRIELDRQCLGTSRRYRQPIPGDAEGTRYPLLVAGDVDFETPHHLIAMNWRLNVIIVQQQP